VLVFVDANNVRRSQWPNLSDEELVERVRAWAGRHEHESVIVFDRTAPGGIVGSERLDERTTLVGSGSESADEWLIGEFPRIPERGSSRPTGRCGGPPAGARVA
jgi:hypothetical protein